MKTNSPDTTSHCTYCGHTITDEATAPERFGERFCSEAHAEEFVGGVRAARMQAAARPGETEGGGATRGGDGSRPVQRRTTGRRVASALPLAFLRVAPAVAVSGEPGTPTQPFEHVHALAFEAAGRALWLGAHTGLYRSEDGGRTWVKVQTPVQGHS